jgi:hypothetical protein
MKFRQLILFLALAFIFTACAGSQPGPTPTPPPKPQPAPEAKAEKPAPEKKPAAEKKPVAEKKPEKKSSYETVVSNGEKLLVFGQTEYITVLPDHIRLPARIDTGATTSSIHAVNIKKFERDGKKWVRFNLVAPDGRRIRMERPWIRTIEVKRHGADQQVRPVVNLEVIMGPLKLRTQFSLTNRSQFKFPVLIGRSLLKGHAVVDVNRKYALSPLSGDKNEK